MNKSWRMHSEVTGGVIDVREPYPGAVSVTCADGVLYTPSEIRRIEACGLEVSPAMHAMKKVFSGEIVQIRALTPQEKYTKQKYGGDHEHGGIY